MEVAPYTPVRGHAHAPQKPAPDSEAGNWGRGKPVILALKKESMLGSTNGTFGTDAMALADSKRR